MKFDSIIDSVKKIEWIYYIKRYMYMLLFVGLCVIDQIIGTASGTVQFGIKNYTGIIIALIILSAYEIKDFIKIPYFIWGIIFFIGRKYVLTWGESNVSNILELQTNIWMVGIYGIVIIRMIYRLIWEKKIPQMRWKYFLIWLAMMIAMAVIRTDYTWPFAILCIFSCFYLTDFKKKDLNNLYIGMIDGLIIGFFVIQGQAWLHRAYDNDPLYLGMYCHHNANALFYVCVYCAVLAKWYYLKLKKKYVFFRGMLILLLGIVVGHTFFSGGRTALITMISVTLIFLLFQVISRKKHKLLDAVICIILICISILICFLPSYYMIRYIPAYVNEPIIFDINLAEKKVQKGDPVDSEKYIELDEALDIMLGRYSWFMDEEEIGDSSWYKWIESLFEAVKVHALEQWVIDYQLLHDDVYIEPGTDRFHPLLDMKEKQDATLVRVEIYKYFVKKIHLIGERNVVQGVWLSNGYHASHCHNVFIQMAYDFGIIVGVVFIILIIILYNRILFGLIDYKSGASYYRLFITIIYLTSFVVFGMAEMNWTYGQLSFTMFFIVQYVLYHKMPEEIRLETKTIETVETKLQMVSKIDDTEDNSNIDYEELQIEELE